MTDVKAPQANLALTFEGLGHAYQAGQWVFRNYSAEILKGNVFVILGPNGRGKSTLLHALLGILTANEGRVESHGRMAFVPQLFDVTFDYTVLDIVLMGRARRISWFGQPSAIDKQAARVALDRVGLSDLASRAFYSLSGGQRQLAILARALVADADILVMDEPTSSLDLRNQAVVLEWIVRLSRKDGLTVIFTTHQPHHAIVAADQVLMMMGEQRYYCGPARDVLSDDSLSELYGIDLKRITISHRGASIETIIPVFSNSFDPM